MVEKRHQDLYLAAYKSFELSPIVGGVLGALVGRSFLEKILGVISGYLVGSAVKQIGQSAVFDQTASVRALIKVNGEVFKLRPEADFSANGQVVDLKAWSVRYGRLAQR